MNPTEEIAARLVGGAQAAYVRELSYFFLHLFGEVVHTNGAVLKGQEIADFDRLARISREEALGIYYKYRLYIEKQTRETLKRSLKATDDILIGQFIRVLGKRRHMTNLATLIGSQTAQGLYEVINRQNIALAEQQEALWYEVTAEAIARHQAGEPTKAVMERGVSKLANSGLETIDYISGTKTTIDAALRRHIVSQANQARNRLLMQRMDEWEWDLVFVDAHFGARPTHAVWQGKVYSRSGRSTEYPPLVESTGYGTVTGLCGANCVVGDTKVSGPYASAAYRRKYSGQIVTIRTALGHNLTVTPNHPILTPQGWVAASQLKKGDYVFSRVNRDRMPLGVRPDKYECEPTIKQEFDSLRDTFGIRTFLGSSANFHNDGIANQNVDVVFVNSSLVDNVKTKRFKHTPKPALFDASRLSDCSLGLGSFAKVSMRFPTTSYSILRMFTKSPSLFQRTSRHSSFGSHSSILRENSSFLKSISNCRLGNTKLLSNNSFIEPFIPKINDTFDINTLLTSIGLQAKSFEFAGDNPIPASEMFPHGPDRSSFIVESDKIVGIDIRMWSGHVYNLSTQNAWYFANSIVTHNCYHNMAPYVPGLSQLPDTEFEAQEKLVGMTSDEYYAATQKQRRYERYIRSKKREIVSLQEAGLDATKQRLQLGVAQDKLRQWVADNHLRRDYQRERAWAVDRQPRALKVVNRGDTRTASASRFIKTAEKRTDKLLAKAQAIEPVVTQTLKSLQTDSRHLAGLEYRLKSRESLLRKIMLATKEENTKLNTKEKINDVLRYTFESDAMYFVDNFADIRSSLEGLGYKFVRVKNTLKDKSAVYRGVNTQVKTPDGYTFEIQFHTPQSLAIKEKNHVLYEQARVLDLSKEDDMTKFAEFNRQMQENSKKIPTPQRIGEVEK